MAVKYQDYRIFVGDKYQDYRIFVRDKYQDYRIFVGGLSWDVTERQLENAFGRFGEIVDCQVMVERDTGRPRGFGFLTFADQWAMEDAIRDMDGRQLGNRTISVDKAQPIMGSEVPPHGYGSYSGGGRGGGLDGRDGPAGQDDCFKCGRPGHWARECKFLPLRSRYGGAGSLGDRYADDRDRYVDDRYDQGRYGDRDRYDNRDDRYSTRDQFVNERYPPPAIERFPLDRYAAPADCYPKNRYGKDRVYERDGGPRGSSDRYGGGVGPARYEGRSNRDTVSKKMHRNLVRRVELLSPLFEELLDGASGEELGDDVIQGLDSLRIAMDSALELLKPVLGSSKTFQDCTAADDPDIDALEIDNSSIRHRSPIIPDDFHCPISLELMQDPVIVSTGQTYERSCIQKWLDAGHKTCPKTQQTLLHAALTPNHALKNLIALWCERNGVESPRREGNCRNKRSGVINTQEVPVTESRLLIRTKNWILEHLLLLGSSLTSSLLLLMLALYFKITF